jgi:hypothetical protein
MEMVLVITFRKDNGNYKPFNLEFKKLNDGENMVSFIKRFLKKKFNPDDLYKFSRFYDVILKKINFDVEGTPRRIFNSSYFYESRVNRYVFMKLIYHRKDGITLVFDSFNNSLQIFQKSINLETYIRKHKIVKELLRMKIWRDIDECISAYKEDIDDYFMVDVEKIPTGAKVDAYTHGNDDRVSFLYIV